jgi:hypothetical protein
MKGIPKHFLLDNQKIYLHHEVFEPLVDAQGRRNWGYYMKNVRLITDGSSHAIIWDFRHSRLFRCLPNGDPDLNQPIPADNYLNIISPGCSIMVYNTKNVMCEKVRKYWIISKTSEVNWQEFELDAGQDWMFIHLGGTDV